MLAALGRVSADEFLIRNGWIDETVFYRALAAELALPFASAPHLSRQTRFPESILTGVAPLAGPEGGFVIAPRGPVLSRLLQHRTLVRGGLAVTAPSLLARAVLRHQPRRVAERCANELPDHAPDLSSRDGATGSQFAVLCAGACLLSFSAGLIPSATLACLGAALSPLFLGLAVLRLAACFLGGPARPATDYPKRADAGLPVYTIIIALYREKRVARRLVAALSRLDYPAAKLDIKLVLEADDRETPAALASVPLPGCVEVIVAPPGLPRTKPRALNVALPLARGRFTVIYDAEDIPDPGQLRLAADAFARLPRDVACLQARLTIDNTDDSWLTRLFTIEYAALFDVFNPGLAEIGGPIALGGTSNHFRTEILQQIHGWDAWNVTEDADLGIRLARSGYRVEDLPSSTLEEAPITLNAWMRQRTRWMKGFVQTCTVHSRHPGTALRQLGLWRFIGAVLVTLGTVLSALLYPVFTGLFILLWSGGALIDPHSQGSRILFSVSVTLFCTGAAAVFLPAIAGLKRRRLWRLLPWVALLPVYYVLVSLAAWRSLWELAVAPFRWNKTSHGLARTSRAARLRSKGRDRPARGR
ncbi:glycosyltransferase family 2 protein [Microvirga subterranea]|uniref:Cellulose synthase/poly-beta-1,6-N-acetylglucosamine synthase-like glycosyltransferase n=1 Tax=Microvirga subterranea TaxID=186651 RepID=A0A370HJ39_9HYPH|nr:glycosyltransferase family 2 protein [Microvirga subterranea]RDI57706.1 cellulose synthase/poly-beta-1,6-N-acetylglucosamine synthase-like glycosyltransferase [Microvirga subterranea]